MAALDSDLGWTLGVVFRAYLKASEAAVADVPGGHRAYQVLTAAASDEAPSQSVLGERLGVDRTVMTYLLDDLERADLVARKPHPTDRRTRTIVATETGRALLDELTERLDHVEGHVLAALPARDRARLKALLTQLATHTNAQDPLPDTCAVVADIRAR